MNRVGMGPICLEDVTMRATLYCLEDEWTEALDWMMDGGLEFVRPGRGLDSRHGGSAAADATSTGLSWTAEVLIRRTVANGTR